MKYVDKKTVAYLRQRQIYIPVSVPVNQTVPICFAITQLCNATL